MARPQNFPNGITVKPASGNPNVVIDDDGNVYFAGRMDLAGNQSLTGNLSVTGTLGVTGASTLTGNVAAAGTLAVTGVSTFSNRVLTAQGADVASASTITLGNGNVFNVTGTTDINMITTTGWVVGSVVYLKFTGIATLKNNQTPTGLTAGIVMGSAGDYISRANAGISLALTSTATVPIWTFMGGSEANI